MKPTSARVALITCPNCGEVRGECRRHLPRKTQKSFRRVQIKPEDAKWSKAVKERDGFTCRRCGGKPLPRGLHAHHIFGRGKKASCYALENGITLCASCHLKAHDDKHGFREWVKEQLGEEKFEELRQLSETTVKRVKRGDEVRRLAG